MEPPSPTEMWQFLGPGYFFTVLLEFPVLWWGLSPGHSRATRLFAALWLTACTYPMVVLVLPLTVWPWWGYGVYLAVAETFAPLAEVLLFASLIGRPAPASASSPLAPASSSFGITGRDAAAIVAANLTSFLLGLAGMTVLGW